MLFRAFATARYLIERLRDGGAQEAPHVPDFGGLTTSQATAAAEASRRGRPPASACPVAGRVALCVLLVALAAAGPSECGVHHMIKAGVQERLEWARPTRKLSGRRTVGSQPRALAAQLAGRARLRMANRSSSQLRRCGEKDMSRWPRSRCRRCLPAGRRRGCCPHAGCVSSPSDVAYQPTNLPRRAGYGRAEVARLIADGENPNVGIRSFRVDLRLSDKPTPLRPPSRQDRLRSAAATSVAALDAAVWTYLRALGVRAHHADAESIDG